ncbi:MAG: tetratricopeptide repeat protein [Gammaproteobacteria bacterium]|nr:tetratricopeptide repeat protein [Gammaproteobacteria bacterium]
MYRVFLVLTFVAVFIAGCSHTPDIKQSAPGQRDVPEMVPEVIPAPLERRPMIRTPSRSNSAVSAIMIDAKAAIKRGRYAQAAAYLERAVRLEPGNALIWHYLAIVKFNQGNYSQAASLASKSNILARGQRTLRDANKQLIARARRGGK